MDLNKQFGILKEGRQLPEIKSPTHETLLFDGRPLAVNLPYAILQAKKSDMVRLGYAKSRLKIVSIKK